MEYKWFILKPAIIYWITYLSYVGLGKEIVTIWNMYKLLHLHPLVSN